MLTIANKDIKEYVKACKKFGIPIAIVPLNGKSCMHYRESDSNTIQMITERIMNSELSKVSKQANIAKDMDMKKTKEPTKSSVAKEQLLLLYKKNIVNTNPKDISILVVNKKESIVAGKKEYKNLTKAKEPISIIKVDKSYIDKFQNVANKINIPISIVENGNGHFMFIKNSDFAKFELGAKSLLEEEIGENKNKLLEDKSEKKSVKEEKTTHKNPDNNIRNKVRAIEERRENTPSGVDIEISKEIPISNSIGR